MKTLFPADQPSSPDKGTFTTFLGSPASSSEAWRLILLELATLLDQSSYETWILPIRWRERGAKHLLLLLPDQSFYDQLIKRFLPLIEECKQTLGVQDLYLELEVTSSAPAPGRESLTSPQAVTAEKSHARPLKGAFDFGDEARPEELVSPGVTSDEAPAGEERSPPLFTSTLSRTPKLNPNYTFDCFVRGPSNQFALATCLNVAENPGQNYNPLFLYGSTGLGKTHLLHAVGNQVLKLRPECIVTYISSERFMNEMIYCIRHNKMWDFRQKYRHCDVFMMDDIQFISGNKATTQEEFFHTFNTLYESKKQIIITSDLFPQDIPDIEERLRNRFQWGLIADIQPPDVEHRVAILMNKAQKLNVQLNIEVAEFIANHAKRNVRELEGALHRIAAFAALQGRPLDKTVAMEIFHSIQGDAPKQMEIEVVQKAVADHFKLRMADLRSKKRQRALTLPRQIAMYLARQHTRASYPEIGEKFGGKDHTTVMHAVKKITKDKVKDLDLKAHVETLERYLEQQQ